MKRDYSVAITVNFPTCFTPKPGVTEESLAAHIGDLIRKNLPGYMSVVNVEDVTPENLRSNVQ